MRKFYGFGMPKAFLNGHLTVQCTERGQNAKNEDTQICCKTL